MPIKKDANPIVTKKVAFRRFGAEGKLVLTFHDDSVATIDKEEGAQRIAYGMKIPAIGDDVLVQASVNQTTNEISDSWMTLVA